MNKAFLAVAVATALAACSQPESEGPASETSANAGPAELATENDKILYALGIVLGDNIADFALSEEEFASVSAGMLDSISGADPRVEMDVYGPQIQILVDERLQAVVDDEKLASAAFADQLAAEPGAERLESGVVYVPVTEGDGTNPSAEDTVTVHYHGTLRDGTVFDSSVDRGSPATFPLSGVIPCWTEGVQRISVGGKGKLLCPSDTAYGDQGTGGIPGGAALLFEVELLSIAE